MSKNEESQNIQFACKVLNIMFYKVPAIHGDESGKWWEAELKDKGIPIRWDEELGEFCHDPTQQENKK